jgi:hypothetical protein
LLWALIGYFQRDNDIQRYSAVLRAELESILFPSEERTERASRDIERLSQQAAELATSSKAILFALAKARQGMRNELRDFASVTNQTETQINALSNIVDGKSSDLLALIADIDTKTEIIDQKAGASVKSWGHAADSILSQADRIDSKIEKGINGILSAADIAKEKTKLISWRRHSC